MITVHNKPSQKVCLIWDTPTDSKDPFKKAHEFLENNPEYDQVVPPDIAVKHGFDQDDLTTPVYVYKMAIQLVQKQHKG
jgi:hypothetical protein